MPHKTVQDEIDNTIDTQDRVATGGKRRSRKKTKRQPVYKVIGESKIPVSKTAGSIWQSRLDMGKSHMKSMVEAWDEAIRYYENDQTSNRREGAAHRSVTSSSPSTDRLNNTITETENIIFSNVVTMSDILYSRNPKMEVTTQNEKLKAPLILVERVVNELIHRKATPGINLKPKARRGVVNALLTNRAWLEVGWIKKNDSSEQALTDLTSLAEELESSNNAREYEAAEGKIETLEKTIDILQPEGPFLKFRRPQEVVVDHNATELDLLDAKYIMISDFISTEFIKARYANVDSTTGVATSIFESTHVLKLNKDQSEGHSVQNEVDTFTLLDEESDHKAHGFGDEESFMKAKLTKVWFVWDKVTRRVLMFNDKDWEWPIWVWDDPYQIDTFFPVAGLAFYEGPVDLNTKGEVTYYVDQQDAINEIGDEKRKGRRWARRNIFYNKRAIEDPKDVEAVLNGPDGTAKGLNVPDGQTLQDIVMSITPPSMNFLELFNKQDQLDAIERISSVSEVLRGGQFKANTTNDAVQFTASANNVRVDSKTDSLEDWLGASLWMVAQLCMQFMSKDMVKQLIGEAGESWENFDAKTIHQNFSAQIVGGSTIKPTSQAKKAEALELGQVLGQFVNAAPVAVTMLMLDVFQSAFDDIDLKAEDWEELKQAVQTNAGQQQQSQSQGQSSSPDAQQPQQPLDGQQLEQALQQMPPELKEQVVNAIQSGADPQETVTAAIAQMQQGQTVQ